MSRYLLIERFRGNDTIKSEHTTRIGARIAKRRAVRHERISRRAAMGLTVATYEILEREQRWAIPIPH